MIFQQFNLVRRASVLDNVLAGRLGFIPPAAEPARALPGARPRAGPGVPGPGRARAPGRPPRRHAVGRRAAARGHRARAGPAARGDPGRRAHREPRSARSPASIMDILRTHQPRARAHARGEPAPARDRAGLRHARRRLPPGPRRVRRSARGGDAGRGREADLRRRERRGETRADRALFVGLVVFAWLVWDTGADPGAWRADSRGCSTSCAACCRRTSACSPRRWPAPSPRWRSRCSARRWPRCSRCRWGSSPPATWRRARSSIRRAPC